MTIPKSSRRSKRTGRLGSEAGNAKTSVCQQVLHEAGYKCSNPRCRYPITLDVHHLHYVSEGGSDDPANLLPLCPTCHQEHHIGKIPNDSLRAWKLLLLSINDAFDRRSIDILLFIFKYNFINRLTGEGVLQLAPLIASGLADVIEDIEQDPGHRGGFRVWYKARLTEKGRLFVEGWLKGDQQAAIPTPQETSEADLGDPGTV